MDKFLIFTIVGLTTAAIYAVIASGLVLTYTTTGIFNFAHGAIGMLAAFAYWQLRVDVGLADARWPLSWCCWSLAPLFGLLLERVIMRGLEGTSEATKLVVSISLLVAMIGLAKWLWHPGVSRTVQAVLRRPDRSTSAPTAITYHQLITIGVGDPGGASGCGSCSTAPASAWPCGPSSTTARWPQLNGARTAPGRAAQLGHRHARSPRSAASSSCSSAGARAPPALSLLIVNAYAAAVFGRLRSLPLTFVGAIVARPAPRATCIGYLPAEPVPPRAPAGGAGHPAVHRAAADPQPPAAQPRPHP